MSVGPIAGIDGVVQRCMLDLNADGRPITTSGLEAPQCISLIGAGGKTTTMLALCADFRERGDRVLVTTTTKIRPPDGLPVILVGNDEDLERRISGATEKHGACVLADDMVPGGKLLGVQPDTVCRLYSGAVVDVILCEADGAARRPLKVHGPREPVIPDCSTIVLIVAGLDAIGQPASDETIHRFPEFLAQGLGHAGVTIDADVVARCLQRAARHVPAMSRTVVVLNKADDEARRRAADDVRSRLRTLLPQAEVVVEHRRMGRVSESHSV
jgi:probable selenium-dependent hydroxylase accessory protein YqeC